MAIIVRELVLLHGGKVFGVLIVLFESLAQLACVAVVSRLLAGGVFNNIDKTVQEPHTLVY